MSERVRRRLTGRARFVGDVRLDGMLHAVVLRSPHAHARVTRLDARAARSRPGVVAVFTVADLGPAAQPIPIRLCVLDGLDRYLQRPLAADVVRYVGEPVAVVVARDPYLAEDARDAVAVDYEPLPPVLDVEAALAGGSLVHEASGSNVAAELPMAEGGDIEAAFRHAAHVVGGRFRVHRHYACPLETRGLVAWEDPATGVLELWGDTKVPHFNRGVLAAMLGRDAATIRFHDTDVGGGFGARGEFYPENLLVPFAACALGRPVRWIEDRRDNLRAMNHSREVEVEAWLAAAADGRIRGLRAVVDGDQGAYVRTHGGLVPTMTAGLLPGPYVVPAVHLTVRCCITNKTPAGTYRGPGYYESTFVRERLLDRLAAALGADPAELRRRNLVPAAAMPYRVGLRLEDTRPIVYDSGDFSRPLEVARARIGHGNGPPSGRGADGRYYGVGLASFVEPTAFGGDESARVTLLRDRVEVELGVSNLGQAHDVVIARICAEALGVPSSWVTVRWGGSEAGVASRGTFGSRVTVMAGSAVVIAARSVRDQLLARAAAASGHPAAELTVTDATVRHRDTGAVASVADLAAEVLCETGRFEAAGKTYAYGTHAARVAVDADTGEIEVLRYVAVEDVGRAIDRPSLEGQVVGAVVQGLGGTLLEELRFDAAGAPICQGLREYRLPTAEDLPPIDSVVLEEHPTPLNPLGAKGGGEGGIIGAGAAVANAVHDALRELGVEIAELPLTPERVRRAIEAAARRRAAS